MTGSERRTAIINQIKNSTVPVSGKALAAQYAVSRQVIVQDIALIRAAGHEIISTNRGYLLNEDASVQRTFKVKHTDAQVEEELYSIVDLMLAAWNGKDHFCIPANCLRQCIVRCRIAGMQRHHHVHTVYSFIICNISL